MRGIKASRHCGMWGIKAWRHIAVCGELRHQDTLRYIGHLYTLWYIGHLGIHGHCVVWRLKASRYITVCGALRHQDIAVCVALRHEDTVRYVWYLGYSQTSGWAEFGQPETDLQLGPYPPSEKCAHCEMQALGSVVAILFSLKQFLASTFRVKFKDDVDDRSLCFQSSKMNRGVLLFSLLQHYQVCEAPV
jgi:hypothetical protein